MMKKNAELLKTHCMGLQRMLIDTSEEGSGRIGTDRLSEDRPATGMLVQKSRYIMNEA